MFGKASSPWAHGSAVCLCPALTGQCRGSSACRHSIIWIFRLELLGVAHMPPKSLCLKRNIFMPFTSLPVGTYVKLWKGFRHTHSPPMAAVAAYNSHNQNLCVKLSVLATLQMSVSHHSRQNPTCEFPWPGEECPLDKIYSPQPVGPWAGWQLAVPAQGWHPWCLYSAQPVHHFGHYTAMATFRSKMLHLSFWNVPHCFLSASWGRGQHPENGALHLAHPDQSLTFPSSSFLYFLLFFLTIQKLFPLLSS